MRSLSRFALRTAAAAALISTLVSEPAWGWGRDGHMMINALASQYLPADVPVFLRDAHGRDVMEWMGPEPDRWRGKEEAELSAAQAPDHFLDEEWADLAGSPCARDVPGCSPSGTLLPKRRYDFIRALQAAKVKHPELAAQLEADKVGMQPWQVEEVWQRLKTDLREYRKAVAAKQGTVGIEVAVLFDAGWLGHYVGDGSQPLHLTIQYNGWQPGVANPHNYTSEHKIHSQFESVYVTANIKRSDVAKLVAETKPRPIDDEWTQYLDYLHHSNALVERTYELEKAGGFNGAGTIEAKAFTQERLAAGAVELRDLIYSAWVHSADPVQEYRGPQ